MKPIEFLKNANVVLIFCLLVAAMIGGSYFVIHSRSPLGKVHVAIDSAKLGK